MAGKVIRLDIMRSGAAPLLAALLLAGCSSAPPRPERDEREAARAEADRIACKVFAEQGELRAQLAIEHNALVELLAVVTSDEWKGALIMAGVHGFHGTPEGQARSQKAIQCATEIARGPRGSK